MFRTTVYLNALLDTTTGFPVVTEVAVSSNPPGSSVCRLTKEQWVNVHSVERDSFQEGADALRAMVADNETFAWVRPFVDESPDKAVGRAVFYSKTLPKLLTAIRSAVALAGWPLPK